MSLIQWNTKQPYKGEPGYDEYGTLFNPYTVECLRHIIDRTSARLVISSSWRLDGIDKMREMWAARNMPGEVFGVTPALDNIYFKSLDGGHDTFSVIPSYTYAIIDDGDDFLQTQFNHIVITEPETGLTKEVADKVIQILR
ncbi:HAD domain-containing protein [Segatella bryantii]|uniref:HAD domain-containing protein n=1 Tax=Segatella bryantii TaxID=77095 RepID=UPI001EDAE3CD|nr:HAD domain-containing protein [Segatella bryantii]UKK72039.1 HAD domain-containing protein [Segatella bryantii]